MGFAKIYEDSTLQYDMTSSAAIETDHVGSAYVCGSGENDKTNIYDKEFT